MKDPNEFWFDCPEVEEYTCYECKDTFVADAGRDYDLCARCYV